MPRYSLRTLLIVLALGPPALAGLLLLPLYLSPGQTAVVMTASLALSGFIGARLMLRTY